VQRSSNRQQRACGCAQVVSRPRSCSDRTRLDRAAKGSGWALTLSCAQVTYPLDLVRTRLAYDVEGRAPPAGGAGGGAGARAGARRGIAGVLAATVRSEGLGGLYRGIGPTLLGILPYAGLKFYVYQSLKAEYRRRAPARARARPGPRVHSDASVLRGLGCGGSC